MSSLSINERSGAREKSSTNPITFARRNESIENRKRKEERKNFFLLMRVKEMEKWNLQAVVIFIYDGTGDDFSSPKESNSRVVHSP